MQLQLKMANKTLPQKKFYEDKYITACNDKIHVSVKHK